MANTVYNSRFSIVWYRYGYHVTLCIGRLQPIIVYRACFGVCAVLVLSVILCPFNNSLMGCYFFMMVVPITGIFMTTILILIYIYRLSITKQFWFCRCAPPWTFLSLGILFEYLIEHVTSGLLYVIFRFPTRIFNRGFPGFATDCPCGVWCLGLTKYCFTFSIIPWYSPFT